MHPVRRQPYELRKSAPIRGLLGKGPDVQMMYCVDPILILVLISFRPLSRGLGPSCGQTHGGGDAFLLME